jgi:hypothetical protein
VRPIKEKCPKWERIEEYPTVEKEVVLGKLEEKSPECMACSGEEDLV